MTDRVTSATASGPDTVLTEPVTVTDHGDGRFTMRGTVPPGTLSWRSAKCLQCGDAMLLRDEEDERWFTARHMGKHTESPSVAAGRKKR